MIKSISKHAGVLAITAFICTLLIVLTYSLTKEAIAAQQQALRLQRLNEVLPSTLHDNLLTQDCTLVTDPRLADEPMPAYISTLQGKFTAIAVEAIAPDGYGGSIRILLAADDKNTVLGVRVLEHNETPGLGDKIDIRISDWINTFIGKTLNTENDRNWAVKKDGGLFDQFTGATITPRAVVNASKRALWFLKNHREHILAGAKNCGKSQ